MWLLQVEINIDLDQELNNCNSRKFITCLFSASRTQAIWRKEGRRCLWLNFSLHPTGLIWNMLLYQRNNTWIQNNNFSRPAKSVSYNTDEQRRLICANFICRRYASFCAICRKFFHCILEINYTYPLQTAWTV